MKQEGGANVQAILAAVLLSVLTLGVFFVLQDYGPESAVRRFHQAAASGDRRELASVTIQPLQSQSVQDLAYQVKSLIATSQIRLGSVQRSPDMVIAEFRYYYQGGVYVILWNVKRTKLGWKVDAEATLETRRGFLGL